MPSLNNPKTPNSKHTISFHVPSSIIIITTTMRMPPSCLTIESMSTDITNDGKPTEIEVDDGGMQTPSTLSRMTIHSSQIANSLPFGYADGSGGQRIKSKLERSGRHKKYLDYGGGIYSKNTFDDSTGMFSLVCGMGRINCMGGEMNWELMREMKKVPSILKVRCEGKLIVSVDDVRGEDCITLVTSHTCSHNCPLVEGVKTTLLHDRNCIKAWIFFCQWIPNFVTTWAHSSCSMIPKHLPITMMEKCVKRRGVT